MNHEEISLELNVDLLKQKILNLLPFFRWGGTPVGQAKVARESGLANNSVALGYLEILNDLGCIVPAYPWDPHKKQLILRKPCKYYFSGQYEKFLMLGSLSTS